MQTVTPPKSIEFSKFIEFTLLLANPKELKAELDQFAKATASFKKAAKQHSDAVKIAATIDIAEAMQVANSEEASRLKVLGKQIDAKNKASDDRIAQDTKDQATQTQRVENSLARKQNEFDVETKKASASLARREQALAKGKAELADGIRNLETSQTNFAARKAKVEDAYAS